MNRCTTSKSKLNLPCYFDNRTNQIELVLRPKTQSSLDNIMWVARKHIQIDIRQRSHHELTTSVVWATKRMAYKQSPWPNLTVHQIEHQDLMNVSNSSMIELVTFVSSGITGQGVSSFTHIDAGRPRGAWAHRRSWLTCMASSMNKSKAMTRPNANCYEIKQPNNSTCILVNQKKGETYHVFWIK